MTKLVIVLMSLLGVVLIQVNCDSGFEKRSLLQPCEEGCTICDASRLFCKRCQYGYKPLGPGCFRITGNKKNCHRTLHCLECPKDKVSFPYSCQKCESGYYPVTDSLFGTYCVKSCPKGYYLTTSSSIGLMCRSCPQTGCQSCDQAGRCLVCKNGRSLFHEEIFNFKLCLKKCPPNYRSVAVTGKGNQCQKVSVPNILLP